MLPATAVPRRGGARVKIPPEEWPGLAPKESDHRDELSGNGFGLAYIDVLVPSKAMTHLWGPRREARLVLPPLVPPEGFGYMPLSCAAQWIATEGGTRAFDPGDEAVWKAAFDQLLGAIASEKVRVVGMKDGERLRVPREAFAGIVVDYPLAEASLETIMSEAAYLQSSPYIDEVHWQGQFNDSLRSRYKVYWTHLLVAREHVRGLWPFATKDAPARSGAPGRPTSMHVVLSELERRASSGKLESSIRKQADALAIWFAANHTDMPPLTAKTISNKIGPSFRRLAGTARK